MLVYHTASTRDLRLNTSRWTYSDYFFSIHLVNEPYFVFWYHYVFADLFAAISPGLILRQCLLLKAANLNWASLICNVWILRFSVFHLKKKDDCEATDMAGVFIVETAFHVHLSFFPPLAMSWLGTWPTIDEPTVSEFRKFYQWGEVKINKKYRSLLCWEFVSNDHRRWGWSLKFRSTNLDHRVEWKVLTYSCLWWPKLTISYGLNYNPSLSFLYILQTRSCSK